MDYFFLVAGFFLEWKEIVLLLISGQFFCGIFGLAMAVSVMTIGGGNGIYGKYGFHFAISASDCVVDGGDESFYEEKRQKNQKYDGSMTVEASIVMSVVILSLASLIRYAYTVHDTVTGSMILEETIEG